MNIGAYSVRNKVVSWLLVIVMVAGGVSGFQAMGKLEDPSFTIKKAKVITRYPGATAEQVQDEVTYHIEEAIQKMPQLKRIKMSISRPGLSDIEIEFQDKYTTAQFPDIYDELRRKITDMKHLLPPGAQYPVVVDDFADVYGMYVALTGSGYTYRDLKDAADTLQRQLILVPGVRKVVIGGAQQEVVYVEISRARLGELGISLESISEVLQSQNIVIPAGNVRTNDDYVRIAPTGEFSSVDAIRNVLISSDDKRLIYLDDIANIVRAYKDLPDKMIFMNGRPALTLGISMLPGLNVVDIGTALSDKLDELGDVIPVGMDLEVIYDQPTEVDKSVSDFIGNVIDALIIVIVVLLLFMGLKVGLIIGAVLLITVAGTLWIMQMFGIELQRVSLGALIIALGMLVDNAIVVAEGMLVRIKAGMKADQAASEVVGSQSMALLGGTVIGILAFSAIGLSQTDTGEFARSLFYVILISLLLSWVTAVSTTPLLCAMLLKPDPKTNADDGAEAKDPYGGGIFRMYRNALAFAIRVRWLTMAVAVALFAVALIGFGQVKEGFFPSANTPMFFVDVWEIEGTDIRKTRDDTLAISEFIRQQPGVRKTTSLVGGGDSRFSLVYEPKEDSNAYAQIIVQTESRDQIPAVWDATEAFMRENFPHVDPILKPLRIGPGRDGKIEARFHGPDPVVLRDLADEAMKVLRDDEDGKEVRNDWRQPQKVIQPVFNEQVGRQLGVTRQDLAGALAYAFEGENIGLYRDGIRLLPILMRAPQRERGDVSNLHDIQVWSPVLQRAVPVAQVVTEFETVFEETVIRGRNRIPTIIASANPIEGPASAMLERVRPQIEAIPLPPGYTLSWGGEFEDATDAQAGIMGALPVGFLLMIITSILLFGKLRQPAIIWLTVPMAVIGITAGLLAFDGSFDFMSLLGALSLIGLLIKNAIVLIEEMDQRTAESDDKHKAILDASVSRMRPVLMAASTTVLGLIPLLQDVFFVNMAITIMSGLTFATLLTLFVIPVLYAIFFGIHEEKNVPTAAEPQAA